MNTEHELGSDLAAVSLVLLADSAVLSLVLLAEVLAFSVTITVTGAPRKTFTRDAIVLDERDSKAINDAKATINDVVQIFPSNATKVRAFSRTVFVSAS